MTEEPIRRQVNEYGFTWGPLTLTRLFSYKGRVVIALETKRRTLEVHAFKGGKFRIFTHREKGVQPEPGHAPEWKEMPRGEDGPSEVLVSKMADLLWERLPSCASPKLMVPGDWFDDETEACGTCANCTYRKKLDPEITKELFKAMQRSIASKEKTKGAKRR